MSNIYAITTEAKTDRFDEDLLLFLPKISDYVRRKISKYGESGINDDVIREAIYATMAAPRPSFAYLDAILRRCMRDQVYNLQDWEQDAEYHATHKTGRNYERQHYYTDKELESFIGG